MVGSGFRVAELGATAGRVLRPLHPVAESLQQGDGGLADVDVLEIGELVAEEKEGAFTDFGFDNTLAACKPGPQTFLRESG